MGEFTYGTSNRTNQLKTHEWENVWYPAARFRLINAR